MKYTFLTYIFALIFTSSFAQNRTYTFSQTQIRNNVQQWEKKTEKKQRTVSIIGDKISLQIIDQQYYLDIISTTHLPDNGVIYLCKDERLHDVTVTLFSDDKMYVYDDQKRYLIKFSDPVVMND